MAKSLRSKRRQRILGVRRKKYKERELKKMWEKHLSKQNGEGMQLEVGDQFPVQHPTDLADDHSSMEIAPEAKVSNKEMKKIQAKWGSRRSIKKQKAKRLKKKKGHAQW